MAKKHKFLIQALVLVLAVFLVSVLVGDDEEEIREELDSLDQPGTDLVHIEYLASDQAITFYEEGSDDSRKFGSAQFRKGLFGWEFAGGGTGVYPKGVKLSWGFSNLEKSFPDYTDLIRGKVLDPNIEAIHVTTEEGEEFEAQVIDYSSNEKLWFLVTDGENLIGSTIVATTADGQVVEEIVK